MDANPVPATTGGHNTKVDFAYAMSERTANGRHLERSNPTAFREVGLIDATVSRCFLSRKGSRLSENFQPDFSRTIKMQKLAAPTRMRSS